MDQPCEPIRRQEPYEKAPDFLSSLPPLSGFRVQAPSLQVTSPRRPPLAVAAVQPLTPRGRTCRHGPSSTSSVDKKLVGLPAPCPRRARRWYTHFPHPLSPSLAPALSLCASRRRGAAASRPSCSAESGDVLRFPRKNSPPSRCEMEWLCFLVLILKSSTCVFKFVVLRF